jgi:P27 family predicted phage terminase small subunit
MKRQSAAKPNRLKSEHVPPATLTDYGREEWQRLAPLAIQAGTLTATTARSFELLVETLATERAAREAVAEAGITVSTGRGGLKPHPAVRSMEQARLQAAALLKLFRLDPGKASVLPPEPKTNGGIWAGVIR